MRKPYLIIFLVCVAFIFANPICSHAQNGKQAVDTLVLCSSDLQAALAPWVDYRRKQGHKIAIRFSKSSASENKKLIAEYAKGGQLKTVFLVGDSGDRWQDPRQLVPTEMVQAKVNINFGSEPKIASDNPYGDLDGDGVPELSVGRLTADSAAELSNTIKRIIRYEQGSPGQLWQRKVNLIAGVGGLGRLVDSIVENTTKEMVKELIPAGYQTTMTYGSWTSPFCPDPRRFSETAIGRFNEGCMFWVYCGHGQRDQLDRIMLPDQNHRILDSESVDQLDCRQGSPIAICLACYTGAHDGPNDCLAEQMMRQPNGPVAVVCGSRVTMPYGMSVLSVEMMNEFFHGDCETLGELMMKAKQRMAGKPNAEDKYRQTLDALGKTFSPLPELIGEECKEHLQLMQLIGDPLLRLKRPDSLGLRIENVVEKDDDNGLPVFSAGEKIKVAGTTELTGNLLVEIAYERGRFRHRPSVRREYDSSDASFNQIHEDYLKANDTVCVRKVLEVKGGTFETDLLVPKDCRGACDIRAMVLGAGEVAIDSLPIKVRSLRQAKKLKASARTARLRDE